MARARTGGTHRRGVTGRSLPQRLAVRGRRGITRGRAVWRRLSARPGIAHLLRAGERFTDRLGGQFAAAITYFSFLSLVPILMVSFSVAGFVLAARPDLLVALKREITAFMPSSQLADSIGQLIDQAVGQKLTVGIVGLLIAAYSGLSWMGNVRDAVRAQWRPTWTRPEHARSTFVMTYVWDLISLAGLLVAVLVTFALTAVGTAAQTLVIGWLGLQDVHWLTPVLTVGPFVVAICADVLIFGWMYTMLPNRAFRADRRTLLIGSLAMSVCFEVLKAALTILVKRMSSSPSGAVFGSVIGLLLFFNLVARAFLMIAAWVGTSAGVPDGGAPGDGAPARGGDGVPEPVLAPGRIVDPAPPPALGPVPPPPNPVSKSVPKPVPKLPPGAAPPSARGADRRGGLGAAFGAGALVGWLYGRASRRHRGG